MHHNRNLIGNEILIKQLTQEFDLLETIDAGWSEIYLDNETNTKWIYYRVNANRHGAGYPVLARQPLPDTTQLIEIAITSEFDDEIFAACKTLVDNERNNPFRKKLLEALEQQENKDGAANVIQLTELDDPLNRNEIVRKTIKEINNDAAEYRDIARRAKVLGEESKWLAKKKVHNKRNAILYTMLLIALALFGLGIYMYINDLQYTSEYHVTGPSNSRRGTLVVDYEEKLLLNGKVLMVFSLIFIVFSYGYYKWKN